MTMEPVNLYDYEARAKLTLPHNNWTFIDAGAMDEFTTRRNRSAFEALTLRPRFLRDISQRDISTTVLGTGHCQDIGGSRGVGSGSRRLGGLGLRRLLWSLGRSFSLFSSGRSLRVSRIGCVRRPTRATVL